MMMWRKWVMLSVGVLVAWWWMALPRTAVSVAAQSSSRLVMKNGEVWVMSEDVETAVSRALTAVTQYNGYVLSQRTWVEGEGHHYADLTVGVPVQDFEALLGMFKQLGILQSEAISGQDVTDRTVDLHSRLANLGVNQERTRGFLEQTTTVTETLHVFQTLRQIESQIGSVQGQQNFLEDRSAAATITLHILPFIATPTPTPTATPTPLPTPQVWNPGDTAKTAAVQLRNNTQDTADFFIYYSIACGPWLLLALLVAVPVGVRVWRQRQRRRVSLMQ
ncbi:MAG: DUF4349 domain-containing protein [Ardenticatenaceae bacterium]|nr:DUF4349 domain-containing protein [Ardenticatenaceae bacterium]